MRKCPNLTSRAIITLLVTDKTGLVVVYLCFCRRNFSLRPDLTTSLGKEAEAIFIELTTAVLKTKVIIGCIYRPPDLNHNLFTNCLITTLSKISSQKKLCYLLGDFNINLMHPQFCAFADHLNASAFYPLITKPTKITATNRTLIHNILTNSVDDPGISGVLLADLSDHLPLFYLAYTVTPFKNGKPVASYRNFCQSNRKVHPVPL